MNEIKTKDNEIIQLRKDLCDLRSKQTDKKRLEDVEGQLEKLKLELFHAKEQQDHIKKMCEKKVVQIEQLNTRYLDSLQKAKMEYFDYISENDSRISKLMSQIKMQEKMLEAYDVEIKNYNK